MDREFVSKDQQVREGKDLDTVEGAGVNNPIDKSRGLRLEVGSGFPLRDTELPAR
jgi:hypothetical protein